MREDVFNDLVVVKRSGQRVSFNGAKIALAIKKAFDSIYSEDKEQDVNKVYESVLTKLATDYSGRKTINVEDIQDIIEEELKKLKYNEIYDSFKKYREKRAISRELCSEKEQHKFARNIEKLICLCENINDFRPNEILLNFGKSVAQEYTKSYLLETKIQRAHDEGKIHIHNLEFYPLGIFSSCHFDLSCVNLNPYNDLTYLSDILTGFSKEICGEVSFPSIDFILKDYIVDKFKNIYLRFIKNYLIFTGVMDYINFIKLKEELSKIDSLIINEKQFKDFILNKEIESIFKKAYNDATLEFKDKVKEDLRIFILKLENCDSKINNNKFSISFGTNDSYEGRLINEILINVIEELIGLKNVEFIYKIKKQINYSENEVNYDIYLKIMNLIINHKNINISFVDTLFNKNSNKDFKHDIEYFSDGRRIYNNVFQDKKISIGRMSLGTVSVNLSLLGLKYRNKSKKEFYSELEEILEICRNSLLGSFEIKANKYRNNFSYLFRDNTLIDLEKLEEGQKVRKVIKQGTFNINVMGLRECVHSLSQKENFSKENINTCLEVITFIRKVCDKYTSELKLNFTVSEIENEKVSSSFISIDKSIYGNIKSITDKNNYSHVFENLDINFEERLNYESKFQSLLNGGYVINIPVTKNKNYKELLKEMEIIRNNNVGFVKFNTNNYNS